MEIGTINKPVFVSLKDQSLTRSAKKRAELANKMSLSDLSFKDNYSIAFLGQKNYTPNERAFIAFKKTLEPKIKETGKQYYLAYWDFNVNSTPENNQRLNDTYSDLQDFYKNDEILAKLKTFKKAGIKDKELKRHIKELIERFTSADEDVKALKALQEKENQISEKVNTYRPTIDGKTYSNVELDKMLETETDQAKRKQIWLAQNEIGNIIAPDFVELVKMRNKYAQNKGYPDFFSYTVKKSYNIDEKDLFKILDDLSNRVTGYTKTIYDKNIHKVANKFNISTDDVMPWHYGLKGKDSITKKADSYIKSKEDLLPLVKKLYAQMGWDLDKLNIEFDIFPRENKQQHGFCIDIEIPDDIRMLLNLDNDYSSFEALLHETGHAIYDAKISDKLNILDKKYVSSVMTEAVAMLFETINLREGKYLKEELGMPSELVDKLKQEHIEDLATFVIQYLKWINFEKEMYKNPDQDLAKLWFELDKKFKNKNIPDEMVNEWATMPHFLTHPAYLQNYLRGEIMAAQIYDSMHKLLGNLTESPLTADILNNALFKYGCSIDEKEAMKLLTGSELKADAFLKQLESLK